MKEVGGESLSVQDRMKPWILVPTLRSLGTTRLVLLGLHKGGSSLASMMLMVT